MAVPTLVVRGYVGQLTQLLASAYLGNDKRLTDELVFFFFAKRAQGHISTEKPTWFDQTSMVKTYDVKIL